MKMEVTFNIPQLVIEGVSEPSKSVTNTVEFGTWVKGEQGPQGPQGVKGDDYILTEQDKQDIAELVEESGLGATTAYVDKVFEDAKTYTDTQIAEIPIPDVSGQIVTHNTSDVAHLDIRKEVSTLVNEINRLSAEIIGVQTLIGDFDDVD